MTSDTSAVKKNADWYYANLDTLLPKYNGRFIAIQDSTVVGDFDSFAGGVHAMLDAGHKPGTFIVHHCLTPDEEKREYFFHTPRISQGVVLA